MRSCWELYVFLLIPVAWVIVFCYFPMAGVQIAFRKFSLSQGLWNSPWAGIYQFAKFFRSPQLMRILPNTILVSFYSLIAGFPLPIIFALGLNILTAYRYKKFVQTKNDEIGIIGSANGWNGNPLSWLQNMFIYCDNTDDRFMVVDGELDVSYDKEAYREFLIYARKLCDEKLLDPLSFTQEYNAAFLPQVTAEELQVAIAICGGVGGFGSNISHYQAAEVIEGPDGYKASTFTPSSGAIASTSAYITCAAESPEACFAFLMIGFSDADYPIIARYGQQGLDWDYCADGEVGLYDALGYPAVFKWLRGDIRSIAGQTSVWGGANVTTLPHLGHMAMSYYVDTSVEGNKGTAMTAANTVAQAPYAPEEVVYKIIYTEEEAEATAEDRANIRSYIKEARTQFVAGNLDPNSDDDWNAYINQLKEYHYEDVLDIDREAYLRTIAG